MRKLDSFLEHVSTVGIAGHVRPDGDCVGSCLAVYNYITDNYPDITVELFLEPIPNLFRFLKNADQICNDYPDREPFDLFLSLDCGDEKRLGKAAGYFKAAKTTLCLDHHISNQEFAQYNYVVPTASSTSELVYDCLNQERITPQIAECIYVGLVHDTGVFQYSCTSAKTMEIAGRLMDTGIDFPKIVEDTFYAKTYEQNRILGHALLKSRLHFDGKVISCIITKEEMDEYGVLPKHLEGIVSQLRVTKGVDTAVFLYQTEEQNFKVSMRSGNIVDVAQIAVGFGGGGHVRAAGVTMSGTAEEILDLIFAEIKKQLDTVAKGN
jgi:phosphoesterase RecJ-like protein